MKKLLVIALAIISLSASAQESGVKKMNEKQVNMGLLYGSYEQSVHELFTVKGEFSFASFEVPVVSAYADFYWDKFFTEWFDLNDKWDFYTGLGLGCLFYSGEIGVGLTYESGARWHFNDKWSLNVAYSSTNYGLGVTMKL